MDNISQTRTFSLVSVSSFEADTNAVSVRRTARYKLGHSRFVNSRPPGINSLRYNILKLVSMAIYFWQNGEMAN